MTREQLKQFIQEHLLSEDGRTPLSSRIRTNSKFRQNNIDKFELILNETSFLHSDTKLSCRLYHIVNDLHEIPKCMYCNNDSKYSTFTDGYLKFCSNRCFQKSDYKRTSISHTLKSKPKEEKQKRYSGIVEKRLNDIDENGLNSYDRTGKKISKSLKNLSSDEKESIKHRIRQTRLNDIDENGLNSYERSSKKTVDTKLKKYGYSYYNIPKAKETCLLKYGVDNIFKSKEFIENNRHNSDRLTNQYLSSKTNYYNECISIYDRHNISITTSLDEYIQSPNKIIFKCNKCESSFKKDVMRLNGFDHHCPFCYTPKRNKTQNEIREFISSLGLSSISNDRNIISPLELDIYIPDKKLAIEYDGVMFHSFGKSKHSMFNNYQEEKYSKYKHLVKTNLCEEKDIQLFHIFENEWLNKKDIVKSMLKTRVGRLMNRIYARKCEIRNVSNKESIEFLESNHLQGSINASIRIGLYYEDELVSLMTFNRSRYSKDYEYELLRFCSKLDTNVVGGFSRLLKHFERTYSPKSIGSYANRRWSRGNVYSVNGFKFIQNTSPNYFYFQESSLILESRIKYQKHKLKEKLSKFDETLTETENMYNNGYRKIYDCGNLVYIKNL